MSEFLELLPPKQAMERLLQRLTPHPTAEFIELEHLLGRVTYAAILAPYPLPSFCRSTVDGYAVRAIDTYGASESLPAYLKMAGEVFMGAAADMAISVGECVLIHTGGMLPESADAVVMIEHTQIVSSKDPQRPTEIEILHAVAKGENTLSVGEDVHQGQDVIPAGKRLRSVEVGGLAALGIIRLPVARRPRVAVISSGDEVVPPHAEIKPGQVRDINTYSLAAMIQNAGGIPVPYGIIPDNADTLLQIATRALDECDVIVITAGSSASARDYTAQVINRLGKPGVLVHGVNVRPGKPTILAACTPPGQISKAVIGLPGNPVSALVIAGLFLKPVIRDLLGEKSDIPYTMKAHLSTNIPSQAGREDWVPVRLRAIDRGYLAEPIFGKSNLIFTLAQADGLIRIPADTTGLSAGEEISVFPGTEAHLL